MKNYNYSKNKHCKCSKLITNNAKMCVECRGKITSKRMKGKNNSNYKDNRYNKKYYCKECKKEISKFSGIYGNGKCKNCKKCSKKTKVKIRQKALKNWQNSNYKEKQVKLMFKGMKLTPNKPETLLTKLLNKILPDEYKYVGNRKVIIDRFNPDFINCNGQKKIIELFGDYWHNLSSYKKRDKRRLIAYNKLGYFTLIIWEHELKDLEKVISKVIEFNLKVKNVKK